MASDLLTIDVMRKMATDIGLTHLTTEHLQQLMRATEAARGRRDALHVRTLTPADEPSNVFQLPNDNTVSQRHD